MTLLDWMFGTLFSPFGLLAVGLWVGFTLGAIFAVLIADAQEE